MGFLSSPDPIKGTGATFENKELFTDPNRENNQQMLQNQIGRVGGRPDIDQRVPFSHQDYWRDQQYNLGRSLEQQATGQGPSITERQLRQGLQQNIEGQMAQAASSRGMQNTGTMQRQLAQNIARSGQEMVGQAGIQRLQEQQQAQQMYGNLLGQARGQDQSHAQGMGQLLVQQEAQRDSLVQQYISMGLSLDQAQFKANQDLAQTELQNAQFNAGLQQSRFQSDQQQEGAHSVAMMKLVSDGAGAAASMSDARVKTEITSDSKSIEHFLNSLEPKTYKYKNPNMKGTAPGQRYGILAQDLEKSKAGKSVVFDTPYGKAVDTNQSIGLIFAALSELNKKVGGKKK